MLAPEPFFEPRGTPFSEYHRIKTLGELADLIVVGAHSRRPAVAAMVGSCADRIVRESSCPVLAVPGPAPALTVPVLHPIYA